MLSRVKYFGSRNPNRLYAFVCLFCACALWFSYQDPRLRFLWRLFDDHVIRLVYRRTSDDRVAQIGVLINTSGCVIPEFDPYDESLAPLFDFKKEGRLCRGVETHVKVEGNYISINSLTSPHRCSFTPLRFDKSLNPKLLSAAEVPFAPHERRAVDADFARVVCWRRNLLGVEAEAFVNFVPVGFRDPKMAAEKRVDKTTTKMKKKKKKEDESPPPRFSVHLIGIDSASRHNSIRHLPKTRKFLEKSGGVEFFGYNKVGDNTRPNLIPVLTGLSYREAGTLGNEPTWPFIWRNYSDAGFWTIFGEDWAGPMRIFNLYNDVVPDHFYTAFGLHMDNSGFSTLLHDCYGDKLAGEKLYEWYLRVLETHSWGGNESQSLDRKALPTSTSPFYRDRMFSLLWTDDWSHDELNLLKRADEPTLELLMELERRRIFEDDVVLFFSDHGTRYGRIMETHIGHHEFALPIFFLFLPPWFQRRFPHFVRNVKINARRLTTPYDLHETLHHLLRLQGGSAAAEDSATPAAAANLKAKNAEGVRTVYSLLHEVPENRTCASIGIPQQYCTCGETLDLPLDDPDVVDSAKVIVDSLNEATMKYENLCARLELKEIEKSVRKLTIDGVTLMTTISTSPGDGIFEMSASKVSGRWTADVKEANRLDAYGKKSACLSWSEKFLKKICYCYEQMENPATPDDMKRVVGMVAAIFVALLSILGFVILRFCLFRFFRISRKLCCCVGLVIYV